MKRSIQYIRCNNFSLSYFWHYKGRNTQLRSAFRICWLNSFIPLDSEVLVVFLWHFSNLSVNSYFSERKLKTGLFRPLNTLVLKFKIPKKMHKHSQSIYQYRIRIIKRTYSSNIYTIRYSNSAYSSPLIRCLLKHEIERDSDSCNWDRNVLSMRFPGRGEM